jgi:hypothetical protein
MSQIQFVGGKFQAVINGKMVKRSHESDLKALIKKAQSFAAPIPTTPSKYDINKRFDFVEKLVKMVAGEVQPSAIITGRGGLGKSYTVTKTLESQGYKDISDLEEFVIVPGKKVFRVVKGYSTAKGLYRTLYENSNGVIVFDDTDAILRDPVALNLLKAALDSYSKRYITWNAENMNDDLPSSFEFKGRVIFISNMDQTKIDQAIRSRSIMIDLSMTTDEIISRMEYIVKSKEFMPDTSIRFKTDAIEFLREKKDSAKELSLRTLISVVKIRSANTDWKEMADYVLS